MVIKNAEFDADDSKKSARLPEKVRNRKLLYTIQNEIMFPSLYVDKFFKGLFASSSRNLKIAWVKIMDLLNFLQNFFLFNLTLFPNFEAKPIAKDQKTKNVFQKVS
jgi:hypothetical protein